MGIVAWFVISAGFSMARAGPESPPPAGTRVVSGATRLFIPDHYRPADGVVNVVVHLHGMADIAERALVASKWPAVVLTVNYRGLSSAYSKPMADPALFAGWLDTTLDRVREARGDRSLRLGRVAVSSFSAGFGGVRELLKQPENAARIDAIVLADSLYCGYTGDLALREVDPALIGGFRQFAVDAAAGRKTLVVTHSEQVPEGYASTTETADDLIRVTSAGVEPEHADWGDGFVQTRRAKLGRFLMLGFEGSGPEDHMRHLKRLGDIWAHAPDPFAAR